MSFERRKVRVGRVVSNKMDKTVVVVVEWQSRHRIYSKSVKRSTKFMAHDAASECRLGDVVRIVETRPLSKTKRWRVAEILQKGDVAEIQPEQVVGEEVEVLAPEQPEERLQEEAAAATVAAAVGVTPEAQVESVVEAEDIAEEDELLAEAEETLLDEAATDEADDEPMDEAEEPAEDDAEEQDEAEEEDEESRER